MDARVKGTVGDASCTASLGQIDAVKFSGTREIDARNNVQPSSQPSSRKNIKGKLDQKELRRRKDVTPIFVQSKCENGPLQGERDILDPCRHGPIETDRFSG